MAAVVSVVSAAADSISRSSVGRGGSFSRRSDRVFLRLLLLLVMREMEELGEGGKGRILVWSAP